VFAMLKDFCFSQACEQRQAAAAIPPSCSRQAWWVSNAQLVYVCSFCLQVCVVLLQTMSNSTGAAWPALIKKLKILVDGLTDNDSSSPAYKAAFDQIGTVITAQRRMKSADWTSLMLKSQVSACVG
jgi:hypothetical protein